VIDEAARAPDDLYRAVRHMLAVSGGRLVCLSTPYGRRGFFPDAWAHGGDDRRRIEVPAARIPRIRPDFLDQERRALGASWFRQGLRCAGLTVRGGDNALRPGLAAVSARLENGTLRVVAGRCPNLLAEAGLYRYSDDRRDRHAEVPVDEHNHALAALRHLISRRDARHMARLRTGRRPDDTPPESAPEQDHRPAPAAPGCGWTTKPSGPSSPDGSWVSPRVPRAPRGSFSWSPAMPDPVRNRIKAHRRIRAGDLVPHELNFRLHPEQQRAALQALYREVGFARSLLAYELPDGRLKLLDGHLRRDLDPDMLVDVEVLDVNDDEARALLLSLDPLAALAQTQEQLHNRLL
jgi:hypothetical protein